MEKSYETQPTTHNNATQKDKQTNIEKESERKRMVQCKQGKEMHLYGNTLSPHYSN